MSIELSIDLYRDWYFPYPLPSIRQARPFDVTAGTYKGVGSATENYSRLECDGGSYIGSGSIKVDRLISRGNFTVSDGSNHVVRGGHITGNLNLSGGTDVELRGVTIEGNLIVDEDDTTTHLKGCHIQGDITIDSGDDNSGVSVTMDGGSYMGSLTDPGGNLTRNAGS